MSEVRRALKALAAQYGKEAVNRAVEAEESLHRAEQWRAQMLAWAREDLQN